MKSDKPLILVLLFPILLYSCEIFENEPVEYLVGLQSNGGNLNLAYLDIDNGSVMSYDLEKKKYPGLARGAFDSEQLYYYLSLQDSVFQIDITNNIITSVFPGPDTIYFLFYSEIQNSLIGLTKSNQQLNIWEFNISNLDHRNINTDIDLSENFLTNAAYNDLQRDLIIEINDTMHIYDVETGTENSHFHSPGINHNLIYNPHEEKIVNLEYHDSSLYYQKLDLTGNEVYSSKIDIKSGIFGHSSACDDKGRFFCLFTGNNFSGILLNASEDQIIMMDLDLNHDPIFDPSFYRVNEH